MRFTFYYSPPKKKTKNTQEHRLLNLEALTHLPALNKRFRYELNSYLPLIYFFDDFFKVIVFCYHGYNSHLSRTIFNYKKVSII